MKRALLFTLALLCLLPAPAGLLLSPRPAPAYGFIVVEDHGC